jgi:hypothetical protein
MQVSGYAVKFRYAVVFRYIGKSQQNYSAAVWNLFVADLNSSSC